jgi:teichoic acid transport system permease protein
MGVRPSLARYLVQLWERREFAMLVPLGELRQRNMDTVLGSLWHVLNPLFQAAIYYLLFGVILDSRGNVDNYAIWMIVGLITFTYTQKSIASASGIIVQRVAMLRTLNFPAGILPIAVTVGELLAHAPAVVVMLAFALSAYDITLLWLLLIPVILLQTVFNLGLGLIVARLTVHFRDFGQLLGHLLKMWLFASGVLFPFDEAPEGIILTVLENNPAFLFIELVRDVLLTGAVDSAELRTASLWAFGALIVGIVFFHRFEGKYSNAA